MGKTTINSGPHKWPEAVLKQKIMLYLSISISE